MENKIFKGIYLHGFQGSVIEEKRVFLEKFGEVYAPSVDYEKETDILFKLYNQFKEQNIDFVSGTSLGAILGYHLAKLLNVPCLLFNPAVTAMNQIRGFIPKKAFEIDYNQNSLVIVGLKDAVIEPTKQINFFKDFNCFSIIKEKELEHTVPVDVFVRSFLEFKKKYFKI